MGIKLIEGTLYYDYCDPVSYFMEIGVREFEREGRVRVERHPLELCPPPQRLIDAESTAWASRLDGLGDLIAEHGLRAPAIVPWTRKAHELALFARERESFTEVHAALFRSHLVDGDDIGRVDVLVNVATAAGLDRSEAKAVLDVDRYAATVDELRAQALRSGIRQPGTLSLLGDNLEGPHQIRDLRSRIDTHEAAPREPFNTGC